MNHIPIALAIQLAFMLAFMLAGFDVWTGAAAGSWYFIGREYAQAEYRLIEHYYGGKRANMPVFAPLREARAWDTKSVLDWVLPTIATICFAMLWPILLKTTNN